MYCTDSVIYTQKWSQLMLRVQQFSTYAFALTLKDVNRNVQSNNNPSSCSDAGNKLDKATSQKKGCMQKFKS